MVKASHLSRKDASKSTRRKIFFLSSFSPNFSALEIGGCCSKTRRASEEDVTLLIAFLQSRYRRRTLSRNVSSKGGQSGFPTNASLVTAADLMKLHLVKSNMRRSFALFASPPQRLRDATPDLCANIQFPEFWCGCTAKLIKINEIEGVNFKCIELFIKSNGMCDRVSWLNIQFWRELIFFG